MREVFHYPALLPFVLTWFLLLPFSLGQFNMGEFHLFMSAMRMRPGRAGGRERERGRESEMWLEGTGVFPSVESVPFRRFFLIVPPSPNLLKNSKANSR